MPEGSAVHQALAVLDTTGLQVEFTAENPEMSRA